MLHELSGIWFFIVSISRRGIGWHLLKAGEELITKMSSSREVYLHCRIIDEGPLNMYTKAGYSIVKTDSILTLLTLQRRKHLMRKELPPSEDPSDIEDIPSEELSWYTDVAGWGFKVESNQFTYSFLLGNIQFRGFAAHCKWYCTLCTDKRRFLTFAQFLMYWPWDPITHWEHIDE